MREGDGAKYFFKDVTGQSGADRRQRCSDCRRILGAKRSAFKQPAGNRMGEQGKAHRGRKREAERDFVSTRLSRRERTLIAGGGTGRNKRHDHRRDRNRHDAERKLVEPVCVVKPRHRRRGSTGRTDLERRRRC